MYADLVAREPFFTHVRLRREELDPSCYPMTVAAARSVDEIRFHPKVTVFAGENGTGKSTLIEALAVAAGFNPEGGRKSFRTEQDTTDLTLADAITLARTANREQDGFFLRGESAYVVINYMNLTGASMHYGGNLHRRSHGEAFIDIFQHRFRDARRALFMLDEVESALSPQRQIEFLGLMHEHIGRGSQFIVSTHSPILMSYPDSRLYWLDSSGMEERPWTETDHYRVYQAFLNRPETVHRILFSEDKGVARSGAKSRRSALG